MPSLGTFTLAGKSGKGYKFRAYPLGTVFKKGFAAVYILTQRTSREATGAMRHKPLYLGQSSDLRQLDAGPDKAARGAAANCICVHGEKQESERLGIQEDLVETCGQSNDPKHE